MTLRIMTFGIMTFSIIIKCDYGTPHNDRALLHSVSLMLSVKYEPFRLKVVKLNVVMLIVVAPSFVSSLW